MNEYIGKDLESMSFAKNYSKWLVEFCAPYLGTTVAEVGAGTGNLTELFSRQPDIQLYPVPVAKFICKSIPIEKIIKEKLEQ